MSIGVGPVGVFNVGTLYNDFVPAATVIAPASIVNVETYGSHVLAVFDITILDFHFTARPRSTTWTSK